MSFRAYDHLERFNKEECEGLLTAGEVLVFPKLDGTNASVWQGDADCQVRCASRNRELGDGSDNHGFRAWLMSDGGAAARQAVSCERGWRIFGEWLIRNQITTYVPEAWRRFWVFDVLDEDTGKYVSYDKYAPVLKSYGLDVIEPLARLTSPVTEEQLRALAATNGYLMLPGQIGEGVVAKCYEWANKYGRQQWGKLVLGRYQQKPPPAPGAPESLEATISRETCTPELVAKERCKCTTKMAAELIGRIFHAVVTEEIWAYAKKGRTINFSALRCEIIELAKQYAPDVFGG